EIGRVAAHAGHVAANQPDGLVERLLPSTRDEHIGAFLNEPLGARQRHAARSPRDDGNLALKLSHDFSRDILLWNTDPVPDGIFGSVFRIYGSPIHLSRAQCEPTLEKIITICFRSRGTSSPSMVPTRPCEISPAEPTSGWPPCFVI